MSTAGDTGDRSGATGGPDGGDAPSDAALLRSYVAGDRAAFGTLVARHRDRLWAVALRTLGDPEEAADAVQDALVSALRGAAGFRGEAQVTTWLHRIVVNACLDRVRRRQARPTVPLPDDDKLPPAAGDVLAGSELALDVAAALDRLPVEQRAALVLVDVQGYPVEEAAAILEVPTGTVKSRCARGRARLAVLLADRAPGNPAGRGRVEPADGTPAPRAAGSPAAAETPREAQRGPDS